MRKVYLIPQKNCLIYKNCKDKILGFAVLDSQKISEEVVRSIKENLSKIQENTDDNDLVGNIAGCKLNPSFGVELKLDKSEYLLIFDFREIDDRLEVCSKMNFYVKIDGKYEYLSTLNIHKGNQDEFRGLKKIFSNIFEK